MQDTPAMQILSSNEEIRSHRTSSLNFLATSSDTLN